MKKVLIAAVATLVLAGYASTSFALLCASDPVPAATLLFPFVTGKYDSSSTATDPVTDPTAPTTLFAVTNVSSSAKIVHFVLWNDLSFPVLDWDVILTGYDVITYSMENILAGHLIATGSGFSPVGTAPQGLGPAPSFQVGVPIPLPAPQSTSAHYNACTNPAYTFPFPVDTTNQGNRLSAFNLQFMYDGMVYSQTASMNGDVPAWLSSWRASADGQVNGYITADVVAACGFDAPDSGQSYFDRFAVPETWAYYGNDPATNRIVDLGNTLIGDWFVRDRSNNYAQGNNAVHIEVDNMDVTNNVMYPKTIADGASFYRYSGVEMANFPTTDAEYIADPVGGVDNPVSDRRESLPSSFAFRWFQGGEFDGGTSVRIWKEIPDINSSSSSGSITVIGDRQYTYWAWDEEERVVTQPPPGGCDVSPCNDPDVPVQLNQFPLETQQVAISSSNFELPTNTDGSGFGWMMIAFPGSNGYLINDISDGYLTPDPNTYGTQAWVDVTYDALSKFSVDMGAAIMGNYLCDGLPNIAGSGTGAGIDGRTDLGNWLY